MSNVSSEDIFASRANDSLKTRAHAEPLVLCVDSATDVRSVAVAQGKSILAKSSDAEAKAHSSVLLSNIDTALRTAGVTLEDIEVFAVAIGPGSFTGLRAGLATIKAFAAFRHSPIAAVPTLHAVALSAGMSARTVAMIPAGRGEVYAQMLSVSDEGRVAELSAPSHIPPAMLVQHVAQQNGEVRWAGSGAVSLSHLIRETGLHEKIELLEEGFDETINVDGAKRIWRLPRSVDDYTQEILHLGLISFCEGATVGAEELEALYVRVSDAELNA